MMAVVSVREPQRVADQAFGLPALGQFGVARLRIAVMVCGLPRPVALRVAKITGPKVATKITAKPTIHPQRAF